MNIYVYIQLAQNALVLTKQLAQMLFIIDFIVQVNNSNYCNQLFNRQITCHVCIVYITHTHSTHDSQWSIYIQKEHQTHAPS